MNQSPPKSAVRLLRWFCHPEFLEEIEWNLEELFKENCANYGFKGAQKRYWGDVFKHIRPMFIKKWSIQFSTQNQTVMWSNYLKIAIRNFVKHKAFSLTNLFGLVLGMTSCLIILQYAYHELSYDDFHEKKDNIYRLQSDEYIHNELSSSSASTYGGIGPYIHAQLPDVKDYVRLRRIYAATLTHENKVFNEERAYYASSSFFKIFSYKLLQGIDSVALKEPNTVVISESVAKKYFGNNDPIGKVMVLNSLNHQTTSKVTGVFTDPPENTHLKVDIIYSFETFVHLTGAQKFNTNVQWWTSYWTYFELNPGAVSDSVESKLANLLDAAFRKDDSWTVFNLQSIESIHLHSNLTNEFEANGSASIVYGLLVVAAFILIIGWLNFISLSSTRAVHRAREVGIRKVMGSNQGQLINQFLLESLLFNILAGGLALLLAILLLPYFEALTHKPLTSNVMVSSQFWVTFTLALLLGALLSGLYPAFIVSRYQPVLTLKGNFKTSVKGRVAGKSIVIFQLSISMILITSTMIVYSQTRYMLNKDLGFDVDQTIVINGPRISDSTYLSKYEAFKTELLRHADIKNITTSSDVPGYRTVSNNIGDGVRREGQSETVGVNFRLIDIDDDFVPSYKFKVAAGRNFSKDRSSAFPPILVNEIGTKHMGFKDPEESIDQKVSFWGTTYEIIGVLHNYHQESPKSAFEPTIFQPLSNNSIKQYSIKVNPEELTRILYAIDKTYSDFFPDNAFSYFLLDDHYSQQYQSEKLYKKLFNLFSGLAIFIACLGLFGLSASTIFQKMKEIGIRRVLGASVQQIIVLLGSEFSKLIVIALIIGLPVSWLLMDDWLSNFAFRIDMNWHHFTMPAIMLFVITALTIYYQILKAAVTNPVETLKEE